MEIFAIIGVLILIAIGVVWLLFFKTNYSLPEGCREIEVPTSFAKEIKIFIDENIKVDISEQQLIQPLIAVDETFKARNYNTDLSKLVYHFYIVSNSMFDERTDLNYTSYNAITLQYKDSGILGDKVWVCYINQRAYEKMGQNLYRLITHEIVHAFNGAFRGSTDAQHADGSLWKKTHDDGTVEALALKIAQTRLGL